MGCCIADVAACCGFICAGGGGGCAGGIALGGSCTPCYVPPAPVCDIPVPGCGNPGSLDTSSGVCTDPAFDPNCYGPCCTVPGTGQTVQELRDLGYSEEDIQALGESNGQSDPSANDQQQSGTTDPVTGQNETTSTPKGGSKQASGGTPSNSGGGSMGAGGGGSKGGAAQSQQAQQNANALNSLVMAISRMGQSVGQMATRLAQTTNTALTGAKNRATGTGSQSDLLILLVIAAIIIGGIVFTRSEAEE